MFYQGTKLKIDLLEWLSPQKNALGMLSNMVHLVAHHLNLSLALAQE